MCYLDGEYTDDRFVCQHISNTGIDIKDPFLEWYYLHKREYNKKWREENPDYYKQYRVENREHINKIKNQWKKDHKEYVSLYNKIHREQNKEHYKEYREKNKEHIREIKNNGKKGNQKSGNKKEKNIIMNTPNNTIKTIKITLNIKKKEKNIMKKIKRKLMINTMNI